MINWKPQPAQYGGGDSAFGAEFAKAEPAIAKQLCDESGRFIDKKEVTVGGYSYKAKIVQDGKFIFVTRKQTFVGLGDEKPEQVAHKAVEQEFTNSKAQPTNGQYQRSADIKKLHDENLIASKELASAILVLANEVQGIKHLLEIVVNNGDIVKKTFKTASELTKGLSTSQ